MVPVTFESFFRPVQVNVSLMTWLHLWLCLNKKAATFFPNVLSQLMYLWSIKPLIKSFRNELGNGFKSFPKAKSINLLAKSLSMEHFWTCFLHDLLACTG